ncbi:MAG: FprA family A-type flavoprotein [Theionarchaea archaeon]|nr:FprA family A-type flavoprotein [Theionarchaea archaeon]MBU7001337.1 FprA family A-type flavoprotein [Theionarchaea archaeon]MBU7019828.1 FprA family A-type flavoprotein [Theionarchaea archaeon]MBU7035133.1 FprA family A-type flavoprotein [Theionarchaea archaeon]MBU7040748.1 FprA family A-type flavoprotein [Theionarchaea archaeon]
MAVRKIKSGIYWVGSLDWDRRLFDELIPLPDGTTYNAYIVEGEKTALIDTVDPTKESELVENLSQWGGSIDFVIANHAEQDHSGSIPAVLELFPQAKVVTNPKCKGMLMDSLLIPEEKFMTIKDGDTLSLGERTLQSFMTPWVHWPETMVTYLKEERILFSCDFLGSHLATSELFVRDKERVVESAKRYYAEIMMPFRTSIKSHLQKVDALKVDIIAPSHGPLYDEPQFILDCYREWVSDTVKNEVILPFVSMHGSTRAMVDYLIDALMSRDITVKPFNLTRTDTGELAKALVDAATIVIACPTVLAGPHPAAVYAAYLAGALRPKTKIVGIIGSYGWGGKTVEVLSQLIGNLQVEVLDPVMIKGYPEKEGFRLLDNLADEILKRHRALKI